MATIHGHTFNHRDFLCQIRGLVQNYAVPSACTFSGTGEGEVSIFCDAAGAAGTITLTCTSGGGDGAAVFNVTGAMTGTITSGINNSLVNGGCTLRVRASSSFGVGDTFTLTMTGGAMGADAWTEVSFADPASPGEKSWITQAPGPSGTDNITMGFESVTNTVSGFFNLKLTGYDAAGLNPSPDAYIYLAEQPMEYWISADDRSVTGVVVVGSVWESFSIGWADQLSSNLPQPYPMFVGGMGASPNFLPSETSVAHSAFFDPARDSTLNGTDPANNTAGASYAAITGWRNISHLSGAASPEQAAVIFPYHTQSTGTQTEKASGSNAWALMTQTINGAIKTAETVIAIDDDQVPAVLRNFRAAGGVGNTAGNLINLIDGQYLIVQNGSRTTPESYGAIRLNGPMLEATK